MLTSARRPGTAGLGLGEVELHAVRLDQPAPVRRELEALLSVDERARASRFVFDRDRHHYTVCRGLLRRQLGAYLDIAASDVRFVYGERGKPALAPATRGRIEFNVSHAAGVAVFAFADLPIGVDVESLDRTVDCDGLAARFFSREEAMDVLAQPADGRAQAFFNCWTRKEAYIKAIGDGLACPLDSFAVTLRPGEPARMRWIRGDEAAAWSLHAFVPAPGYAAAVATRAPIVSAALRQGNGAAQ